MRTLKILIWIAILYGIFGNKQLHFVSAQQKGEDRRVARLETFLAHYHSPLQGHAKHFVAMADVYGLDYRLLPVVSCVESSCGKHYKYNAFGWGSDSIDFGNDAQDITTIARKISTLSYYQTYRKTQDLHDFALAYNGPYAEDYYKKLTYFMEKIK